MKVIVTGTPLPLLTQPFSLTSSTTGASGVLGSAVYSAFKWAHYDVLGLAHSRPSGDLKAIDLLDQQAVETLFQEFKPDCVYIASHQAHTCRI